MPASAPWDVADASRLASAELDAAARAIAEAAATGELDERECAHRIATLIATSPIPAEVARYRSYLSAQQREDLTESLRWSLVNTVLDSERGFFDLDRMRTASFAGWLRQTAIAFASRDAVVRPRSMADRLTVLWDTTPGAWQQESGSVTESPWFTLEPTESAEQAVTSVDFLSLLGEPERLLAKAKGMRATTRIFATSVEVRRALSLPRLCVPSDDADRQWVLETCQRDSAAAARSLRAVVELLCGLTDVRPDIDERLLALWDDFPLDKLQMLEDAPDNLIDVLVVGQVMPAPKPSRDVLRAMRKAAKELCPARGWQDLAGPLVASFVARTTSPVSDFDSLSDDVAKAALAAEAKRLAAMWPQLVERAVAWPGAPLGADEDEVSGRLARMLHELMESD